MQNSHKIVLASSNAGKIAEFQLAFKNSTITFLSLRDLQISDIEETGLSFVENALLKARHAAKHSKFPVIADDSGLIVDALNGQPGIYSARFAGINATRDERNLQVLSELKNVPTDARTARFYCCLVYLQSYRDQLPIIVESTWEGMITQKIQGDGGFGYEPIFYCLEMKCAASELSAEQKIGISHRGKAIKMLIEKIALPI